MTKKACIWLVGWSVLLLPVASRADDLTGADRLICAAVSATECFADGTCVQGEPEDWNVPRFMRMDLAAKILSTTKASGQERSTPMQSLTRDEDRIFIQGAQTGRAVSMVINESTGGAAAAIVLDGHVLTVFAHCTPVDGAD